jgi:cob(I)alamin adenosyltransferase
MKRITLLLGGIVGFLLGSYAGRGPYESLEGRARRLRRRPEVKRVADQVNESVVQLGDVATSTASKAADRASHATAEAVESAADRVSETVGHAANGNGNGNSSSSSHSHAGRTGHGVDLKSEK